MEAGVSPETDFIGVRCYGTVGPLDAVVGQGEIIPDFGQPVTFHITALDDEMLGWLKPGVPISFVRPAAESGPPTATTIRLGGAALPARRADVAGRKGTGQAVS